MRNKTVLPDSKFMTSEMVESKTQTVMTENQKLGRLFNFFAALQILMILGGAILGFFIAPASMFVSTTETQAFVWIVLGFVGLANIALGAVLIVLSIVAALGIRQEKKWGKICGIIAAILAVFEFPLGTIFGIYLLRKLFRKQLTERI